MRGAPAIIRKAVAWYGIIPADAGSTRPQMRRAFHLKDHPRGCGEHSSLWPFLSLQAGSSPRMRGALIVIHSKRRVTRIIPADAGSTVSLGLRPYRSEDHPRGCGEHRLRTYRLFADGGSSPRMRGARRSLHPMARCRRIIPADAGSTEFFCCECGMFGDHPRGCGEHHDLYRHMGVQRGSSPRMRGAPQSGLT